MESQGTFETHPNRFSSPWARHPKHPETRQVFPRLPLAPREQELGCFLMGWNGCRLLYQANKSNKTTNKGAAWMPSFFGQSGGFLCISHHDDRFVAFREGVNCGKTVFVVWFQFHGGFCFCNNLEASVGRLTPGMGPAGTLKGPHIQMTHLNPDPKTNERQPEAGAQKEHSTRTLRRLAVS